MAVNATAVALRATDGMMLAATRYDPSPSTAVGRVVLIAGATGVKRTFYDRFARDLAERGFAVLTLDYRGIGDSRPRSLRGFSARMRDWGEKDLVAAVEWIGATYPGHPFLIVGHSAGGQLVGLMPNSARAAGLLAVAAQSGYWRFWAVPRRYLMAVFWNVLVPVSTAIAGYFPSKIFGIGQDLPAGVAREWGRWCRHPDYMTNEDGTPLRPYFGDFRSPILALSFSDDGAFAPRPAVDALLRFYTAAPVTHHHIDPRSIGQRRLGHWGFFRESGRSLWDATAAWLANPSTAAAASVATGHNRMSV